MQTTYLWTKFLVSCCMLLAWPNSSHNASTVASRRPWLARVHAQYVQHIPEVQAHRPYGHLQPPLQLNACYVTM